MSVLCNSAPHEVMRVVQHISGDLMPDPELAGADPAGQFAYASCLAGLKLRHITPLQAPRFPYHGRYVVTVECGHMAWCPTSGSRPSTHWPVCAECSHLAASRTPANTGAARTV